ncbi:MAG: hypothetical protein ABIP64_02795 [Burkholderiales bacterium]
MKFFYSLFVASSALLWAANAAAQGFDNDELKDQVFWVKPAKQSFRRLEFYRQPKLDAISFIVTTKKQFRVTGVTRGWVKVHFISAYTVFDEGYLPIGYFKRFLYIATNDYQFAFDRATFFKEDPDAIQARMDAANAPKATPTRPQKSVVSKFFRHKKKCCGLDDMTPKIPMKRPAN